MDNYFVDGSGDVVPVPAEQIPGATAMGWLPASAKQIADAQLNAKFGTTSQQAITALEGAGQALSFGLSTAVERKLGVPREDIAAREQINPVAHGLGTAAGVAGGLFIPGSAPALIGKAGRAVTSATAKALPEATSALARVASRGAALGAGSAIEGAAYGAGQVVHEAALGDPTLTAESALAHIGLSTALGAGIGMAGGALSGAMREFGPGDFGAKVRSLLEQSEGHSNLNATNARPREIKKVLFQKGEESATKIGVEARDLGIIRNPLVDSPDTILERANSVKAEQGQAMDRLLATAAEKAPQTTWAEMDAEIRAPIVKALRSRGATMAVADQFEAMMDRYSLAYADRPLGLDGLWKAKQDVGDFIYSNGKVLDPWAKELNTPVKRVYDHIDGLIESGIKSTSGKEALAAWQARNRAFEVASTMGRLAAKGIERGTENNAVSLTGTLGAMSGFATHGLPGGALAGAAAELARRRGASALGWAARGLRDMLDGAEAVTGQTAEVVAAQRMAGTDQVFQEASSASERVIALSVLERMQQATNTKIESGIAALVRDSAAKVGRAEVVAGVSSIFGRDTDGMTAHYTKRAEQIQKLTQDPQLMQVALERQTDDLHDHAPNTAQAMQITSARAVSFLASKLPKGQQMGPLAHPWEPSRSEMARFLRYLEAIENPTGILRQAAAGTLTPEGIEAVASVYPSLLTKIRASAVSRMSTTKAIPYRGKMMLSMIMGQDMDGTTSGPAVLRNQIALTPPPPMPMPSPGEGKLTLAERTKLPSQTERNP